MPEAPPCERGAALFGQYLHLGPYVQLIEPGILGQTLFLRTFGNELGNQGILFHPFFEVVQTHAVIYQKTLKILIGKIQPFFYGGNSICDLLLRYGDLFPRLPSPVFFPESGY